MPYQRNTTIAPRMSLTTAPVDYPIDIDGVHQHSKIDVRAEDDVIERLIRTATRIAERELRRRLFTQTWAHTWDAFPPSGVRLVVPFPPVASISSIAYIDANGDSQTWASSNYKTFLPSGPNAQAGLVEPVYGEVYPDTREEMNAVTLTAVHGWDDVDDIPDDIKSGLYLLVSHLYSNRDAVLTGTIATELPMGVAACWDGYRSDFF